MMVASGVTTLHSILELTILIAGAFYNDISGGRFLHLLNELLLASFLILLPWVGQTITMAKGLLKRINSIMMMAGGILLVIFILGSIYDSSLFVSLDSPSEASQYILSARSQGAFGPLMQLRDILLLFWLLYLPVGLLLRSNNPTSNRHIFPYLVVILISLIFSLDALYKNLAGSYILFPDFIFQRSTLALIIVVLGSTLITHRRFIRSANLADSTLKSLQEKEQALEHLSTHDILTGLPNREALHGRLLRLLAESRVTSHRWALAILSVDQLKSLNEALGSSFGDRILKAVGQRIPTQVSARDELYRFEGNEFVLIINGITSPTDAGLVCERIYKSFGEPILLDKKPYYITLSTGLALFPNDGQNEETLTKKALEALSRAKLSRNAFRFYSHLIEGQTERRIQILNILREALKNEKMRVVYQPIVDENRRVCGMEALVRWPLDLPLEPLPGPAEFIPMAEGSGLIPQLGKQVFQQVLKDREFFEIHGFEGYISINLSVKQLDHPDFFPWFESLGLQNTRASKIYLELTESSFMDETLVGGPKLGDLKKGGCLLLIDDFGTGFSSLSYLREMPFDGLKIDKRFVDPLEQDPRTRTIAKAIMTMAIGLDMKPIAEGVETEEQFEALKSLGCKRFQGYLFYRPMEFSDMILLLDKKF